MSSAIRLGVAAMDRKARSKPMQNILNRMLSMGDFEVIVFGDKVILDEDVDTWPIVDVLISFFSTGFPLEKAIKYVKLRKPVCVNDLNMQTVLWDRRAVLRILAAAGVPTPPNLSADRDGGPLLDEKIVSDIKEQLGLDLGVRHPPATVQLLDQDVLQVNGESIHKPYVEKPVSGEDHNIHIYFSAERGGGGRRLFRKVGNKSSEFDPDLVEPRMDGSYVYESFMDVDNAEDIKVYTIGPEFAYAETRKSPVVDGLVKRNPDGKEIRYVTQLSSEEREMARKISLSFKQFICGFDLLRVKDKSYVIDVNGWSFVKGNDDYYAKCAEILAHFCRTQTVARPIRQPSELVHAIDETSSWVLKANVTVFRHGDRSPKQKIKRSFKSKDAWSAPIVELLQGCREEVILRSQLELVSDALQRSMAMEGAPVADLEFAADIIERKKQYPGTKIQLKPTFDKSNDKLEKVQVVIKWGGEFSHAARHQARDYGTNMRRDMMIMNKEALRNCSIYTSSERRVFASAEIFAEAFLRDEGSENETPKPKEMIVRKDLLDDSNAAKDLMDEVKKELQAIMQPDSPQAQERPPGWPADLPPPSCIGSEIRVLLQSLGETMHDNFAKMDVDKIQQRWCTHETPALFRERWDKVIEDFREKPNESSRASELADMLSHDGLHNRTFLETIFSTDADDSNEKLERLHRLYRMSLALFSYVCPREYGITPEQKEQIGLLTSQPLLQSIVDNLKASENEKGLCAFYFTKESHVHTLLNLILCSHLNIIMPQIPALDYFSSITFEVYERENAASNSPADGKKERSLVISLSEGAHSSEILFIRLDARHALTPLPSRPLTSHMDFDDAVEKLSNLCNKREALDTRRGQIEGATLFFGEQDADQRVVPISEEGARAYDSP
ncbi:inositol hexakisphosphate and diphosphoinositol-pentakisphosphate kinase [Malassezia caprae]|uniref:Inositol hexakisphosphate and diphosphoinositol-pentakisphosphate kinase n=1 Tax=Malassezia caprae TaxID=1381934 RepID=A0AAF0EBD8_9BASI|nr:inositol hexakisphosphate and diphosphoinositol-pentakisphosphate kinase [Malassezia caprae]